MLKLSQEIINYYIWFSEWTEEAIEYEAARIAQELDEKIMREIEDVPR